MARPRKNVETQTTAQTLGINETIKNILLPLIESQINIDSSPADIRNMKAEFSPVELIANLFTRQDSDGLATKVHRIVQEQFIREAMEDLRAKRAGQVEVVIETPTTGTEEVSDVTETSNTSENKAKSTKKAKAA